MSSADAWQTRYFRITRTEPEEAAESTPDPRSSAYLNLMNVPAERVMDALRNRFVDNRVVEAPRPRSDAEATAEAAGQG
ncbi:hypothetical protein [Falsiroseomonas sp.]|uniref:hypothetical protein n=1 Tax=Falsiroseomonas sp. TaxID=2870721 RepID=UPI003F7308A9